MVQAQKCHLIPTRCPQIGRECVELCMGNSGFEDGACSRPITEFQIQVTGQDQVVQIGPGELPDGLKRLEGGSG